MLGRPIVVAAWRLPTARVIRQRNRLVARLGPLAVGALQIRLMRVRNAQLGEAALERFLKIVGYTWWIRNDPTPAVVTGIHSRTVHHPIEPYTIPSNRTPISLRLSPYAMHHLAACAYMCCPPPLCAGGKGSQRDMSQLRTITKHLLNILTPYPQQYRASGHPIPLRRGVVVSVRRLLRRATWAASP